MTPITTFAGRTVAVFGLGISGIATCRALAAGGATVVAADDTPAGRDAASAAGFGVEDLAGADWSRFAALVLAPGVPLTHPAPHWTVAKAKAAGVEIIGDIELFCRERAKTAPDAPFIAITGTNGKSTTTALIAHILRAAGRDVQMGGNIGTAILALEPPAADRFHVVEMSSFQIELTPSLDASVGVLLNISPDHLDRHGTIEHYAALKARLVEAARRPVIGEDDDWCRDICERLRLANRGWVDVLSANERMAHGWYAEGSKLISQAAMDRAARRVRRPGGPWSPARPPQHPECARRQRRLSHRRRYGGRGGGGARHVPRTAASPGGDRPHRPHAVHQRQQGDQCRQRRHGARRVPGRYPLDHRRQAEGGRHRPA